MSEHVRPKHYRKEPLGWAPQFMALWISRVLFYPTLIYNVTLYYLWPTKFRNWWDRVDDSIILGALPFYWHVPLLYNQGVRGVVNTCDEYAGPVQTYARYGIEQLRVPIVDYFPPTLEDVKVALRFIRKHTNNGDSVYVHCKAGRGRSTTIVLCYLIERYPGVKPVEAQTHLNKKRPQVSPNVWKRQVVFDFWDTVPQDEDASGTPVTIPEPGTSTSTAITSADGGADDNKKDQ